MSSDATPRLDQAALERVEEGLRTAKRLDDFLLFSDVEALLAAAEERERLEERVESMAAWVKGEDEAVKRERDEARARAEHLEATLREELDGERLACEVYSVPQVDCGHCWGCRVRQALAASGATAIRVRYDSSTGRPLPGHAAAGQQQEGE
jgi:hypothetical protein